MQYMVVIVTVLSANSKRSLSLPLSDIAFSEGTLGGKNDITAGGAGFGKSSVERETSR